MEVIIPLNKDLTPSYIKKLLLFIPFLLLHEMVLFACSDGFNDEDIAPLILYVPPKLDLL